MKLYEHPDFEQAILQASDHFRSRGLRPALIEKDYYVTEVLRIIASTVMKETTRILPPQFLQISGSVLNTRRIRLAHRSEAFSCRWHRGGGGPGIVCFENF